MKILLVYPEYPVTYWGFQHALRFIRKKAAFPPLGLLTVAALLPADFEKKLVDLNTARLRDRDILWADYVFISAMAIQKASVRTLVDRCRKLGVKTAAGGPLFTSEPENYPDIDHLLLNEGEITIPMFLRDLESGRAAHLYTTDRLADLNTSPVPAWELIDVKKYASLNIQYSRGCPYNCDFCNITALYGNIPRVKQPGQLLAELDTVYRTGWRGSVFFVDDNFIGNKKKITGGVLPALTSWMEEHGRPFTFLTEASVNLADDDGLMTAMVEAGFGSVFVGIETPDEAALAECRKTQNKNRDLIACVKKIQRAGLEVQGGFIVGFDSDREDIFARMVKFIQESGIVTAMVGLLNAPRGTGLYRRLRGEGRITEEFGGDNTDCTMNFMPRMDKNLLLSGYRRVVTTLYSPKYFYRRVYNFLRDFKGPSANPKLKPVNVMALLKSIVRLGILGRERFYYWRLFFWALIRRPRLFPLAIRYTIYGYHFRRVYDNL